MILFNRPYPVFSQVCQTLFKEEAHRSPTVGQKPRGPERTPQRICMSIVPSPALVPKVQTHTLAQTQRGYPHMHIHVGQMHGEKEKKDTAERVNTRPYLPVHPEEKKQATNKRKSSAGISDGSI